MATVHSSSQRNWCYRNCLDSLPCRWTQRRCTDASQPSCSVGLKVVWLADVSSLSTITMGPYLPNTPARLFSKLKEVFIYSSIVSIFWWIECPRHLYTTFEQYAQHPPEYYGQEFDLLNNSTLLDSVQNLVTPRNTVFEMKQLTIRLPHLQKLHVHNCSVTQLVSLSISDCPELNWIFFEEGAFSCDSSLSPTLSVRSCPNLEILRCAYGACTLFSTFSVFGRFACRKWQPDCPSLTSISIGVILSSQPVIPNQEEEDVFYCFSKCNYFCLDSKHWDTW